MNKQNIMERHIAAKPADKGCASNEWLAKNICSEEFDELLAREFAATTPATCEEQSARVRAELAKIVVAPEPKVAPAPQSQPTVNRGGVGSRRALKMGVAWMASLVAMVALAVVITLGQRPAPVEWTLVRTGVAEQREVTMPDGSTIWLNGESEILYPSRFEGDSRKVYASGELYADIVKNPEVPFVVDANDVSAKVYGTKFNMKAYADSRNVEIALVEGAVTMGVENDGKNYVLRPGDIVRYDRDRRAFETYRFEVFNYATWKDNGNLYFVNMNLGDIVKELERKFGTKIIIEDEALSDLRYYASFVNNENVEQILHALNAQKSMRIRRQGELLYLSMRNK